MSFIVDRRGNKHHFEDHEQKWFGERAIVFAEGAELQDFYLVNLYRAEISKRSGSELVKQIEFTEEPTKEQIMYELGFEGLTRYDFATIEKGYRLDWGKYTD